MKKRFVFLVEKVKAKFDFKFFLLENQHSCPLILLLFHILQNMIFCRKALRNKIRASNSLKQIFFGRFYGVLRHVLTLEVAGEVCLGSYEGGPKRELPTRGCWRYKDPTRALNTSSLDRSSRVPFIQGAVPITHRIHYFLPKHPHTHTHTYTQILYFFA